MMLALIAAILAAPTPFRTIVESHFDSWDANRDQVISATELDCLALDHSNTGELAAAIASLKLARRSTKVTYPPFTREYLLSEVMDGGTGDLASEQDEHERAEKAKGRKGLIDRYSRAYKKIASTKRELFADHTPDLDACRQGPLGDCFLVAAIGAAIHRDANSIKDMIQMTPDGGYSVTFRYGGPIQIPPLTDAQMCLTSTTGDEGLWLPVLEEAFGSLRARTTRAKPGTIPMEVGSDAIAHGGSIRTTIKAFTGNETKSLSLKTKLKADQSNLDDLASKLRAELRTAAGANSLMGLSTPKEGAPPGIANNHAYAVLSFDAEKDEVRIWNPHGNSYKPKREPGLKNGFPTSRGVFTMKVTDIVQVFRTATFEIQKPTLDY